jgi:periplasmic divalent cation tolerance protein
MDTGCVQVVVAIDTEDGAERIAERLVDGRLAACVQVAGPVTSRYRWEGRVEVAREFLLVAKTVEQRVDALIAAVRDEHPYDVPEFPVVGVTGGRAVYLEWIRRETTAG